MVTESADAREMSVQLPQSLAEWLEERAAAEGIDREELLIHLLAAYRKTVESDDSVAPSEASLADAVEDELDGRLSSLEERFETDIQDVRQRVLQLRDAVEERAPADHEHAAFDRIDELADRTDRIAADVERLDADADEATDGIESIEERLDEAASKIDRLARVLLAVRRAVDEDGAERRRILERLKRTAATEDIGRANCNGCGGSVRIALLVEPACPHCGMDLSDVVPARSFFRKPKLLGVDAPALEEGTRTDE